MKSQKSIFFVKFWEFLQRFKGHGETKNVAKSGKNEVFSQAYNHTC